ncbi:MAG: type II toxin-antitoxin system PemK/MazF family toxin [Desulfobacteraceae bacterium]|nr:type II toxin-antitoxin system PemK/MazF family toxin [Desulfobacteraceae bacterium]
MNVKPGDIVSIPFPYTDLSTRKRRPVLVLTIPDNRGDFISLPVTSVPTEEAAVCIKTDSLSQGNLPKTSWARYDKVFTLSTSSIKRKYGTLRDEIVEQIKDNLCTHLGCF